MRADSRNTRLFLLAVVGSVVLLNLLAVRTFFRLDVTKEGVYTLAKASKDTMTGLEDPVTVTAYFTENLPAPYSGNARYVRDLLAEYRAASKGKLSFEFIDPSAQETDADKETKREVKRDIFGRQFREQTSVEKDLGSLGIQPVEIRVIEQDQMQTRQQAPGEEGSHPRDPGRGLARVRLDQPDPEDDPPEDAGARRPPGPRRAEPEREAHPAPDDAVAAL
jgi:hypothetical protein